MKRFVLILAIVVGLSALWSSAAQAQYGYYGTFRGGGRNISYGHVRSLNSGGIFIQSYAPPSGYGYYGERYGYAPAYGYGPGYGYGADGHHHHHGCGPYNGYGGYSGGPGISIRW